MNKTADKQQKTYKVTYVIAGWIDTVTVRATSKKEARTLARVRNIQRIDII